MLWTGDLFIWVAPNAGNPQKVQRYAGGVGGGAARRWRRASAELLIPGHGMPIFGAERVRQALTDTAEWLETLVEPDARADERGRHARARCCARCGRPPTWPSGRICRPVYDEPDYVVRNLWRLYGGWYDGVPSISSPRRTAELGARSRRWPAASAGLVARAPRARRRGPAARWPAT